MRNGSDFLTLPISERINQSPWVYFSICRNRNLQFIFVNVVRAKRGFATLLSLRRRQFNAGECVAMLPVMQCVLARADNVTESIDICTLRDRGVVLKAVVIFPPRCEASTPGRSHSFLSCMCVFLLAASCAGHIQITTFRQLASNYLGIGPCSSRVVTQSFTKSIIKL